MVPLDYRNTKPIYSQIKSGLRKLLISGVIEAGEKLPSIRELAARLTINPNTISRAYRELEAEGYLYTVAGKGTFAAHKNTIPFHRQEELLSQFDEVVTELLFLSIKEEDLTERIDTLAERSRHL